MHTHEMFRSAQSLGCVAGGEHVRVAFEVQQFEPQQADKWLHVLPLGKVEARDGRTFQVQDAAALLKACELPMLVDWEHRSEFFMGSSEAAGWIEDLLVEPGSGRFPSPGVWGRVDWTPKGREQTESKAYRYLSPVLLLDVPPGDAVSRSAFETRTVLKIASVALTNTPALHMQSIDSFRASFSTRLAETVPLRAARAHMAKQRTTLSGAATSAAVSARLRENGVGAAEEKAAREYMSKTRGRR